MTGFVTFSLLLSAAHASPTVANADKMVAAFEARQTSKALKAAQKILRQLERDAAASETGDGDGASDSAEHEGSTSDATERQLIRTRAQLIETFALLRLRRLGEARRALDALTEDGPDLGNLLPNLRIKVTANQGDCTTAQAIAGELTPESIYWPLAWNRIASCWLAKRDAESASAAVDQYLLGADSEQRRAAADILRGRILEVESEWREARDLYREVMVAQPLTNAATAAEKRLKLLRRRGVRHKPLTPAEMLSEADALRAEQRLASATKLYDEIKKLAAEEIKKQKSKKGRSRRYREMVAVYQHAELGLAEIDIVERSYRDAGKRVGNLLRASDAGVRARALYLKGDLQARGGSLARSLRTFNQLLERSPDDPYAMEAALSAANMSYSHRFLSKSRGFSQWVVENAAARETAPLVGEDGVHRSPEEAGSAADHGYWLLAWNERRSGAVPEVVDSYLGQIDRGGPLGSGALYWRARLALDAGDTDGAAVFFEILSRTAPTSFYALVGRDLIPEAAIPLTIPSLVGTSDDAIDRPGGEPRDMLGLVVLTENGLRGEARELLRQLPIPSLDGEERVAAAWLYRQCDELSIAASLARGATETSGEWLGDPVLYQLAYPRPFEEAVLTWSEAHEVPPDLLYAIMREESAFNPKARSPRDARGLMQMIRPTARRVAAEAEIKRFSTRELFEPEMAIRLGSAYVASLLARFDGNLVAAIASYHAGEERVAVWLRTRNQLGADEFIEDIPYPSTRAYVKKVLGSYAVYRLLYSGDRTTAFGTLFLDGFRRRRAAEPEEADSELARAATKRRSPATASPR